METQKRVEDLLHEGGVQLAEGNRREAHRIWRQAAALNPKDKRIWQALVEVVDNNDDRLVCLQNIINLDPTDEQAMQRLISAGGTLPPGLEIPKSPLQKAMPYLIGVGVLLVILVIVLIFGL